MWRKDYDWVIDKIVLSRKKTTWKPHLPPIRKPWRCTSCKYFVIAISIFVFSWCHQYLRSRKNRSAWIFFFEKFLERLGKERGGSLFIRVLFHVEVSIYYPFFRVLLSFTVYMFKQSCLTGNHILLTGKCFIVCREKAFS